MNETTASPGSWRHGEALVGDVRLHYVEAGRGPLIVLLHGFPEFWYAWRHQIPALAAAGYRVVAVDQRGYNTSSKPRGVKAYCLEHLVGDVRGLIHALGESSAFIGGHDWGGAIAWSFAMHHPEATRALIVLNGPHPRRMIEECRTAAQLRRSWYIFFFQLPWLPEWLLRLGNYRRLDRELTRDPTRPGAFTPDDLAAYRTALAQPGALTATLNYYRALFRGPLLQRFRAIRRIDCPTLLIWGEQDRYLGLPLTERLERWVPDLSIARIPDASHWVQADAPERVNALILEFLQRLSPTAAGSGPNLPR